MSSLTERLSKKPSTLSNNPLFAVENLIVSFGESLRDFVSVNIYVILAPIAFLSEQTPRNHRKMIRHIRRLGPNLYFLFWISLSIVSVRSYADALFSTGNIKVFAALLIPAFTAVVIYNYLYRKAISLFGINQDSFLHISIRAILLNYLIIGCVISQSSTDLWMNQNILLVYYILFSSMLCGLVPATKLMYRLCNRRLLKSILVTFFLAIMQVGVLIGAAAMIQLPTIAAFAGDHYTVKVYKSSCEGRPAINPAYTIVNSDTVIKMQGYKSVGILYSEFFLHIKGVNPIRASEGFSIIANSNDLYIINLKFEINKEEESHLGLCDVTYGEESDAWFSVDK